MEHTYCKENIRMDEMAEDAQRIEHADDFAESSTLVEVHDLFLLLDTRDEQKRQDQA